MPTLYPLLLQPEFHERPWGARDLGPIYERKIAPGATPIGEAWLTGDACKVANGTLAGKTLDELAKQFGDELIGANAPQRKRFPLLIKFLFPREKLSVQVHPDDDGARRIGQPCGKTECWYVLAADPGAQVGLGLKPGTTREDFRSAIKGARAEQLLNWINVAPGDLIYVDAGTVHAIGPGSILVETQQNSDTTYRLYDYGRPRPLHIEEGIAAMKETTDAGKVEPWIAHENLVVLVHSPFFYVARHRLGKNADLSMAGVNTGPNAYRKLEILVGLKGSGIVEADSSEAVRFGAGDAVVVPAATDQYHAYSETEVEFLTMKLPPPESNQGPPVTSGSLGAA